MAIKTDRPWPEAEPDVCIHIYKSGRILCSVHGHDGGHGQDDGDLDG